MFAENTDPRRRLALQLALQLPQNVSEAREVLALTNVCLEQFLVDAEPGSALARARRLGWPVSLPARQQQLGPRSRFCLVRIALFWAVASVMVATPIAMLMMDRFGAGAIGSYLLTVVMAAAVFGAWPALLLSLYSAIALNFFFEAPLYQLSWPTPSQMVVMAYMVVFSVAVPWLMRRGPAIRDRLVAAIAPAEGEAGRSEAA